MSDNFFLGYKNEVLSQPLMIRSPFVGYAHLPERSNSKRLMQMPDELKTTKIDVEEV